MWVRQACTPASGKAATGNLEYCARHLEGTHRLLRCTRDGQRILVKGESICGRASVKGSQPALPAVYLSAIYRRKPPDHLL